MDFDARTINDVDDDISLGGFLSSEGAFASFESTKGDGFVGFRFDFLFRRHGVGWLDS